MSRFYYFNSLYVLLSSVFFVYSHMADLRKQLHGNMYPTINCLIVQQR